ncbi:MAG: hypothetical protein V1930_07450 [Pseudomonadota bacterium]
MKTLSSKPAYESSVMAMLEKLPIFSFYEKTRGWPFLMAWFHRISGILILILALFQIYILSTVNTESGGALTSHVLKSILIGFIQWILAIPVIFHTLNGGRLILYENFGNRNDAFMIRWMCALSIIYLALLGLLMLMGNQGVSPFLFWLVMFLAALILGYRIAKEFGKTKHDPFWKWQRISGAFLLVMVPAYILMKQLNPSAVGGGTNLLFRLQGSFVRFTHLVLLVGVLYHGGYGLFSVVGDYLASRAFRVGAAVLIGLVMLLFLWMGVSTVWR